MHRIRLLLFLFSISSGIHAPLFAQSIPEVQTGFGTVTIDDGLSQGFVYGGVQDKDGFVWLATADGLNRYDGNSVKVYRNNPDDPYSLPDNFVWQVAEDGNGNLWIGTASKGLILFDREYEKFYPVPLPYDTVNNIQAHTIYRLHYTDKRLFVKLPNVLLILNPEKIIPGKYTPEELKVRLKIIAAEKMADRLNESVLFEGNTFWKLTNDSAVFFTPDAALQHWKATLSFTARDLGLPAISLYTGYYKFPGENKLCIIKENKIYVYDIDKRNMVFEKTLECSPVKYNFQFIEFDGKLFFIEPCTGLSIYEMDLHSCQLKRYLFDGKHTILQFLFKDKTGVIWLKTDAKGLILLNRQLNAFHKADIGRYVHGSKTMITCYENEIREFSTETGTSKVLINREDYTGDKFDLRYKFDFRFEFIDHNGIYWRKKSDNTLVSYNSITKKFNEYKLGFKNITYLFEDKKNYLWVFQVGFDKDNHAYLSKLDTGYTKVLQAFQFPVLRPYEGRFLNGYWQDEKGVFWFATPAGLFRFDPDAGTENKIWKHWKNIHGDTTSLAADNLNCLCPDPKEPSKYLWLGTRGYGFDRFEISTGKCLHYTDKDGLPNNMAYDILPDEFGNLWISTNKGLSCFTPPGPPTPKGGDNGNNINSPFGGRGAFRNFTEEDGIAGNEFNGLEGKKISSGELFFGGVEGITWFRPAEVLKQQPAMPLQFTSLSLNNKEVNWKENTTALPAPISYAKTIMLKPEENIFSVSFSTMDFRNKSNKLYKYYLEGFDKTWQSTGTKNEATYTNLDPGDYVFHVTGTNCDGVWNEKGNLIKVTVLPAWYETAWFKIIVFLFIAGGLYGFYRYRLMQALKLQKLRNRIASDLHDEIGSTLSSISLFGEVARKNINNNPGKTDNLLEQINEYTSDMMDSMGDIVWTINTRNDNFDNLINRMRAFSSKVMETREVNFVFNAPVTGAIGHLDMTQRKNVYLIFKEAVNNAAKYSCCKNLHIDVTDENGLLKVCIKDDGKGFDTGASLANSTSGNGLINMKKRAGELKGNLEIKSKTGAGTHIELTVKI